MCVIVLLVFHLSRLSMSIINIFTVADSVAALIWASALACAVAMVMLLLQRILTLDEYMTVSGNITLKCGNSSIMTLRVK